MVNVQTLCDAIAAGRRVPFSFTIGGRPAKLSVIATRDDTLIAYEQADLPLTAWLTCRPDPEHGMLTLQPRLFAADSLAGKISDFKVLDLEVQTDAATPELRGMTGGFVDYAEGMPFPPNGLKPWVQRLEPDETFALDSDGCGKSSSSQVPTWILHGDESGIWFGPEWSGCWDLSVARRGEGVHIEVGLPVLDFRMLQGEEIELPAVTIGTYRGTAEDGHNTLRRVLREAFVPPVDGEEPRPTVVFQGLGGMEAYQDGEGLRAEADVAAQIGVEVFVLNGGWYQSPTRPYPDGEAPEGVADHSERNQTWFETLGDYTSHAERLPEGVEEFGEYVRDKGMKLGLWFDPRINPRADAFEEHRDILLPPDESMMEPGKPFSARDFWGSHLVDLGRQEGQNYLFELMDRFAGEYGAEWIWLDMNAYPRDLYWNALEPEDRRGLMELRYYRGLYTALDRFRSEHPGVRIESCANGGMVIDLGMIRRSHSIWINDYVAFDGIGQATDMDITRNYRSGANHFLPTALVQSSLYIPKSVRESDETFGEHNYLSHFAGSMTLGQGLCHWKPADVAEAARCVGQFKEIRHYLRGDYHELFPLPEGKDAWDGWQFHDPETERGLLMLFRLPDSEQTTQTIRLHGLSEDAEVRFNVRLGSVELTHRGGGETEVTLPGQAALVEYEAT